MIFLVILLVAAVLIFTISLGFFLSEYDGILDDQILQEYLDKLGDKYKVHNGQYNQRIEPSYSALVSRYIERSPPVIGIVFPYHIEHVGAIPVWSKSKSRIDAMFATGVKRDFKRERLGLE
jgi:hypothetical protein